MKTSFIAPLIIILFITGCVGNAATPMNKRSQLTTRSVGRTETLSPTSLPTLANTPTTEIKTGVIQNCIDITPDLPNNLPVSGVIAFETHNPNIENNISFFDFSTGEVTELEGSKTFDASVSPDRNALAYYDYDKKLLEVISAHGKKIRSFAWEKNWGSIAGWLDNQKIMITANEELESDSNFVKYPRSVMIIDVDRSQVRTLSPDYPNIDRASHMSSWGRYGTTVYDPTLTYVVYPGFIKSDDYEGGGYILYHIPEKRKLAQLPSLRWHSLPIWFENGSHFIVFGDNEFYMVGIDGVISPLTHLNPDDQPGQRMELLLADYYTLSPDNRQVAFWLRSRSKNKDTLAILDIETGKVTDTCIQAGFNQDFLTTLPYPVWSEDGKWLVVPGNYRTEDNGNDVILVDLEMQKAFLFLSNLSPAGWFVDQ